jgi:signal transduction histidine kinase/CheY-like chemotaxis protein
VSNWIRFRRFVLPSLTLAIFLVSLIHSFLKTETVEEGLGSQVTRSIWLASQVEIDYLRLLADLERYGLDEAGIRHEDVTAGFVRLRGRLVALLEGEDADLLRRSFEDEIDATVRPLLAAVEALQPDLESLDRTDPATIGQVRAAVLPFGTALHELVEATRRLDSATGPMWLDRDWAAYWEVGWSLAGMLFSGALLVVILIREIHRGDELLRKSHSAEAALLLARNAAEQANNAKSRFLVAANHDMRQPLQSLSLYTAALQGSDRVSERETICDEMSGAIQAMGTMLDVLLDIENLEDGHVRVEFADFPVSDLLGFVEREFRLSAREKGLELRVLPSSLMIRSDPVLLERIVQNLVSNAVSYTHDGKVIAGCRRKGDSVRIEVWDNGVGVAEDELQTIFEDYHQVDNPARDRRKGLGLGLGIVQRIAKLLDHEIIVRSKLGKGSLFAIQVPRAAGLMVRPARPPAERRPQPSFDGRALVAIEDEASILDGLERLLTAWGAEVFACSTVDEALIQLSLAAREPDVIIADYRLSSGLNGIHAVEKIRTSFDKDLPAIVITGDTSTSVTESIKASGCRLVHKPLEPQVLRRLIDELLSATENGPSKQAVRSPIDDPVENLEQV